MKNMGYSLRYLPLAMHDISDIDEYLSRFYPSTAAKFFTELQKHLKTLISAPEIGEAYGQYRRLVVQKYLVFYKINYEEQVVDVYRVLRGSIDVEKQIVRE